jgi:hypothetical protein
MVAAGAGGMTDADTLLAQIEDACRRLKIAQSTFGRLAVNDGKFVTRLQQGGRVTLHTVNRIHHFIAEQGGPAAAALRSAIRADLGGMVRHGVRFYDDRQKHLMFASTTSEKRLLADRALHQLSFAQPRPPAIRILDGATGDGTALARLLRGAHRRYSWLPFYVVAKEISAGNVRLILERMADRFQEHPQTMLVVTNLAYADAPWLKPAGPIDASAMVWKEMPLDGDTAGEFEEQIAALSPFLDQHWQVRTAGEDGHSRPREPAVLVLYRRDNKFALDSILPRRGMARADYDFILLSHPYRARAPIEFKARRIVTPLVRALRPSGRLMGVQGYGDDPGHEILRAIWPEEQPFTTRRAALMEAVRDDLGADARLYDFHDLADDESLWRFDMHALPTAAALDCRIDTSALLTAWNAASYVAQIDDERLAEAMSGDDYLDATAATLRKHGGLWFNNETFVVSRRSELG